MPTSRGPKGVRKGLLKGVLCPGGRVGAVEGTWLTSRLLEVLSPQLRLLEARQSLSLPSAPS